jgi:SAGA-associated factor 29
MLKVHTVEKPKYIRGAEVFYRYKKGTQRDRSQDKDDQGEGILCTITNVIGEGKQRRYEILDVEPEEGASPYRASLAQMTAIPMKNEAVPDASPKKTVLAMYPGTTTFYRAEVVAVKGKETTPGHVRLRFEGEDEKDKEMVVEKRYVLQDWSGK